MEIIVGNVKEILKPKNKLEEDVLAYILSFDGKAFPAKDLETWKKRITETIEKLNKEHKRSTPAKPEWQPAYDVYKNARFNLFGLRVVYFEFILAELTLSSN